MANQQETNLPESHKPLALLPGLLIAVGLFFLIAGVVTGGPELVGGLVFGIVALAAAGAILYRRAYDERPKNKSSNAKVDETDIT